MKTSISLSEHQKKYTDAIRQAKMVDQDTFQAWFNQTIRVNQSIVNGYWDFALHICTKKVCAYLKEPENKVALEIGYGGGRLLNAACSYFQEAIGIDIHDEQTAVETFLQSQNKHNFRLFRTSGDTLPLDSQNIDFIYSFIVLQHLPSINTFINYVKETYRCLKPRGIAQLYFGKFSKLTPLNRLRYFRQGYGEIPEAKVNHTSLVLRTGFAKKLCQREGFKILETGTSYKRNIQQNVLPIGGQGYITLFKE